MCQKPSRKNNIKKFKPNKITLNVTQNKQRQPSKQKGKNYAIVNDILSLLILL